MHRVTCPQCNKRYQVPKPIAGKYVKCGCGVRFDSHSGEQEALETFIDELPPIAAKLPPDYYDPQAPYAMTDISKALASHGYEQKKRKSAGAAFASFVADLIFILAKIVLMGLLSLGVLFALYIGFDLFPFHTGLLIVIALGVFIGVKMAGLGK